MNDLIDLLNTAFSNNAVFYKKTHSYHWAVKSPMFPDYHKFLDEIYKDAQESIDTYGEALRKLGELPLFDDANVAEYTDLDLLGDPIRDPIEIFTSISDDLDIIISDLQDTYDAAQGQREYGLQNFIADRIDQHKQQQWMILAILGED
jgi:starvation-inducible DNA-binding protein